MNSIRSSTFAPLRLCATLLFLLFAVGCDKKLPPETLELLKSGALAAKERAVGFAAQAKDLKAREVGEQIFVTIYAQSHAEGLAAEAKGLSDLVEAAGLGSFHEATFDQLRELADTARARAMAWKMFAPHAVLDPAFVEVHSQALDQLAVSLTSLAAKLPQKKP